MTFDDVGGCAVHGIARNVRRASLLIAGAVLVTACSSLAPTQQSVANPEVVRALAPNGTLRAAINFGNPILANKDPATGMPVGVSVDLARELGSRLRVPVELVVFASAGKVVDAIRTAAVDVAFVALDRERAVDTAYSAPYVIIEGAYLVRNDSPIARNDEVDRAGHRIAVGQGSAYDLYLSREIKSASLVRVASSPVVTDEFLAQKLDVAAGVRQQLEADAARVGGVRVLDGRFMTIHQAMGIPVARTGAVAYLRHFVEDMKAGGFVSRSLERHGIKGAVVAPAAAVTP